MANDNTTITLKLETGNSAIVENVATDEGDTLIECGGCGEDTWFEFHRISGTIRQVNGTFAKHEGEVVGDVAAVRCQNCSAVVDVSEETLDELDFD